MAFINKILDYDMFILAAFKSTVNKNTVFFYKNTVSIVKFINFLLLKNSFSSIEQFEINSLCNLLQTTTVFSKLIVCSEIF